MRKGRVCNAVTRQGTPCGQLACGGSAKCRYHGGKSLRGASSATFKTGRHSKFLPERLASRYEAALADKDLLSLRDEIALIDSRIFGLLPNAANAANWEEIADNLELRRRLTESEFKRLHALQQLLTIEQAMTLVGRLLAIVRTHVSDQSILAAIAGDLRAVVDVPSQDTQP